MLRSSAESQPVNKGRGKGKQLSEDNTLFEADVDLNSVIQLWEVKAPPPPPASKDCPCPESDDSNKENSNEFFGHLGPRGRSSPSPSPSL